MISSLPPGGGPLPGSGIGHQLALAEPERVPQCTRDFKFERRRSSLEGFCQFPAFKFEVQAAPFVFAPGYLRYSTLMLACRGPAARPGTSHRSRLPVGPLTGRLTVAGWHLTAIIKAAGPGPGHTGVRLL